MTDKGLCRFLYKEGTEKHIWEVTSLSIKFVVAVFVYIESMNKKRQCNKLVLYFNNFLDDNRMVIRHTLYLVETGFFKSHDFLENDTTVFL